MKRRTFAELYCEREGLAAAAWPAVLLARTLYPHARPVAGLLRLVNRRHFLADYEFVEDVGHMRSLADFTQAMGSFLEHPDNEGLLRRQLRIRVSARRMLAVVRGVFEPGNPAAATVRPGNTFKPFGDPHNRP